jgi:hypothetical protein
MAKGNAQKSANQSEKVVTKYDLKKKRREEEAKREKRNSLIVRIVSLVVLAAVVISVAVAQGMKYYRVNKEYIEVNGVSVSEVEFDLYYGISKANIVNSYGSYLSYLYGYDSSTSDKLQNYSDEQTWYDYFGDIAIDTIKVHFALLQIADEKNFDYTTYDEDLAEYKESVQEAADESSISVNEYYKQNFGSVVTEKKIEKYLYDYLKASAVRELLTEELAATDSEIESYYSQNKNDYDTVNYRSLVITATDTSDSTALAAAKSKAEEMQGKITDEASFIQLCKEYADDTASYTSDETLSLTSDESYSSSDDVNVWAFDDSRTAGNTTVIEDTSTGTYTVVYFLSKKSGLDDNKETIGTSVLSTKYQEYIENYTNEMTVNTKNRIVQVVED